MLTGAFACAAVIGAGVALTIAVCGPPSADALADGGATAPTGLPWNAFRNSPTGLGASCPCPATVMQVANMVMHALTTLAFWYREVFVTGTSA